MLSLKLIDESDLLVSIASLVDFGGDSCFSGVMVFFGDGDSCFCGVMDFCGDGDCGLAGDIDILSDESDLFGELGSSVLVSTGESAFFGGDSLAGDGFLGDFSGDFLAFFSSAVFDAISCIDFLIFSSSVSDLL